MMTTHFNLPRWLFYGVLLAVLLALPLLAQAQTGGTYDLTWNTIDSGGGPVSGGTYTLDGTLGQSDAGSLSGGGYTLNGGYWFAATSVLLDQLVYLPLVLK